MSNLFFCLVVQMLLPEGIRRENCKMYEEVEIPPNEPMPVGFEEKPVYISEIDEVGAAVCLDLFAGTNSQLWGQTPRPQGSEAMFEAHSGFSVRVQFMFNSPH